MYLILLYCHILHNVSRHFSRPHRKGLLRSTQRMHVGKPKLLQRGNIWGFHGHGGIRIAGWFIKEKPKTNG